MPCTTTRDSHTRDRSEMPFTTARVHQTCVSADLHKARDSLEHE